jgi:pimeloyl-ACP methyl ester carboxylesterase
LDAQGVGFSDPMRPTLFVAGLGVLGASVLALGLGSQSRAWRDPSPHQVRWITVDSSVKLEVLDWGGSGRPIVLLGCYLSAHVYDEFAPKLTEQFHVFGITRRGIGASDKPTSGYAAQRSADDVLEVLDALNLQQSLLVGTSCAGQILTVFASPHSDRLNGLVYLDGATDPTLPPAAYDPPMPDPAMLPRSIKPPPAPDYTSFEAYRIAQQRDQKVAFPEAELRQQFVANPDGSVGRSLLSPEIRRAITVDARVKPNYGGIRVPVLAIYQADRPFEEVAADFVIRNEQERAALRQQYAATRAMYIKWQHNLLAGVPTARIVELPGASLFMFLSNEADVLREIRAFAATLTGR